MEPKHLVICHRNRLFADCLSRALADALPVTVVVREFGYSRHAEQPPADLALVDCTLCLQAEHSPIPILRAAGTKYVVMVVNTLSQQTIHDCIAAEVDGCVLEDSSLEDLVTAVQKVQKGERWFSPEIVNEAFSLLGTLASQRLHDQVASCDLTTRELEVVQLIAWEKLSNKEIAKRLYVSVYTVKNHVHNIIEKLGVNDRFEAAQFAARKRWLTRLPARG